MMLNSNLENCEKLAPTQKPTQMFGLKFGMQGLICYMSGMREVGFGSREHTYFCCGNLCR